MESPSHPGRESPGGENRMPAVNGVGEPCAGEPHARFEVAGAGNGAARQMVTAVKRPAGETRGKVAIGPNAGDCHRASPRPYSKAESDTRHITPMQADTRTEAD